MTLHPLVVDGLVRDRHAELRRDLEAARRRTLARRARRAAPRPGTLRRRTGWLLVEVGLRLAVPKG